MTHKRRSVILLQLALAALAGCMDPSDTLAPPIISSGPSLLRVPTADFVQLDAGGVFNCALRENGTVRCWGSNNAGQSTPPADLAQVTQVSAGGIHACALISDDTVRCWGEQGAGRSTPPDGLDQVTQVSAGGRHTCAVISDGTVTCWGENSDGRSTPPDGLAQVTQVSVGSHHTCARKGNGTVACWGLNLAGQSQVPDGLSGVVEVSAGGAHTCAAKGDGTVVCWGSNGWGERNPPADLDQVTQVSAGGSHNCARREDGTVVCWGMNVSQESAVPAGLSGIVHVSSGTFHTCALKTDETIVCWGGNDLGQGRGPTIRVYPTATFSATPASVVAGESFTLALGDAQVPGHPEATQFTYAFDCGSGYGPFSSSATASCPTTVIGTRNVRGTVRDQDGDDREYTGEVEVMPFFAFSGFLAPVRSDALNQVKAGQGVPIRFSLGSDYGLDIFGAGPTSSLIDCDVTGGTSDVAETATAGKSSLSYDPATQIYTYIWKTQKGWAASCRRLELQLTDGQVWAADFHFSR